MRRARALQSMSMVAAVNASTIHRSSTLLSNSKFFQLHYDLISKDEEAMLFQYLDPIFKRKKYQGKHWDSVIAYYKEIELETATADVSALLDRVRATIRDKLCDEDIAFIPPHAVDLDRAGVINPHVDSIKFSGDLIAGLSICSTRILRLSAAPLEFRQDHKSNANTNTKTNAASADCAGDKAIDEHELYLPPRSLYMLRGPLRYHYCHSILGKGHDSRAVQAIPEEQLDRRISVMFRNAAPEH